MVELSLCIYEGSHCAAELSKHTSHVNTHGRESNPSRCEVTLLLVNIRRRHSKAVIVFAFLTSPENQHKKYLRDVLS